VAMAAQGAGVQQLWNEWQEKETELLRRVAEAEAAAAEAAQRASTARRMYESAEELAKKRQAEKNLVNNQLGTQASILIERNRKLKKERDSLSAEVSTLEDELAQKCKRYEVLCAQRQQALDLRARGGKALGGARADGNTHSLKTDTGAAQAREIAARHLEELRTMEARLRESMPSSTDADTAGVQSLTSAMTDGPTDSSLTVSIDEGGSEADVATSQQPYRSFAESMDDAYSASRTPLRRAQSEDYRREDRGKSPDVKFGRRSSPSPANHKARGNDGSDGGSPLSRAAHQQRQRQRHNKQGKLPSHGALRRHKSTPSPVGQMIRGASDGGGMVGMADTTNMIVSKDGKTAMERPSIRVAQLNNDYAEQALAELRASMAADAEIAADGDDAHAARLRQVTAAAALPSATKSTSKRESDDCSAVGGMLAAAIGGSEHLVPPASQMTVAVSPGSARRRRGSNGSGGRASRERQRVLTEMTPTGTPSGIGLGL
jgi:hypothetical protein